MTLPGGPDMKHPDQEHDQRTAPPNEIKTFAAVIIARDHGKVNWPSGGVQF